MEVDLALASSSGLNTTVGASQLLNGVRQTGPFRTVWLPGKQNLNGKIVQKRWYEMTKVGKEAHRNCVVKADMTASATTSPVAPLLLESPSGQFLAKLLQSHPHLVSAAAEQQLVTLAEARDAASQDQTSSYGSEVILYKRIAELRAQERCKSLEDIMYALISERFVGAGIAFVPQILTSAKNQRVDTWPAQDKELERVHSDAALELIREHLSLVLGAKGGSDDQNATAQISKLRMGRVYAASAVYGYFISRVDKRFQLEKTMANCIAQRIELEQMSVQEREMGSKEEEEDLSLKEIPEVTAMVLTRNELDSDGSVVRVSHKEGARTGRLRSYVKSFDSRTLQQYATVRSKESVSVIERHTEALFGKPEIKMMREGMVAIAKDEAMILSFAGLRRLVLEAVAFGSFLWDVETYVDTHYHFVNGTLIQ